MSNDLNSNTSFPRVAVLGCGAWGKNLVRNFAELGALTAVCDSDTEKVDALASLYNVPSLSEDQILADPTFEAIVIASLAPLHTSHAEKALKAGKHVYIEKPMALTVKDAKNLWDCIPNGTDILITHGPPYGILDKTINGNYAGCRDLLTKVY